MKLRPGPLLSRISRRRDAAGARDRSKAPYLFAAGHGRQIGIGVLAACLVLAANLAWRDVFQLASVLIYFAGVVLASRFAGVRGGLAAAALSLAAMAYLNMPPAGFPVDRIEDRLRLGEFAGLSALIAYISERLHRHLRQLAEREEHLRLFAESVQDYGISTLDREGRLTSWNPGQERLTGYAAAEALGKRFSMLFPPEDAERDEPERLLRRATASTCVEDEGWRVRKDGSRVWVYARICAVRDARGSVSGYTAVAQDMTRRRLEEERFRLALESAPSGMLLADKEGRIVLVNRQVERIFGYKREELIGQTVELLVPKRFGSHKAYREAYQREPSARRMGEGRDLFGRRKDGSEVPVEIGLTPIRAEEGSLVLAAVVDITERKKAEDGLRQAHEELQNRVGDLEEFSYTVSHDLRAPLRAVEGFSRMLAKRTAGRLGPEEQGLLDRMAKAVSSMDRLIEDVLVFGHVARKPLEITAVDFNLLVEDVLARYPARGGAEVRVNGPLAKVEGNESLLTQILANLLSNAAKFVPDDRKPVIEIATEKRGERVRLTVKDNGIGIPEVFREKVFKPFERIPGPIAREGSGMGLAIVRKAAERMGARVGVESEPGAWSLFWVDLPAAAP